MNISLSAIFSSVALHLQLTLKRFGLANILALALPIAACAGYFGLMPELRARDAAAAASLTKANQSLASSRTASAPAPSATEQNLQNFYDLLGDSRYAEQQVKTLFAIAAKNSLTLNQAEYKLAYDKSGAFRTYTIVLPVHGQYGAIRSFCQQVLLAIPFASLDQVDFKRDSVNNANLEAKLRLTLYLDGSTSSGSLETRESMQQGAQE